MTMLGINMNTFILFVLCGILIICYIGPKMKSTTTQSIQHHQTGIYTSGTSFPRSAPHGIMNQEPFQQANDVSKIVIEDELKKALLTVFTGNRIETPTSSGKYKGYFNTVLFQTRPWNNLKYDLNITYFPFSEDIVNSNMLDAKLDQQKYDIISLKKADRGNDFYLNGRYGLDINIIFRYNYEGDYNNEVDVDAYIRELPPTDLKLSVDELREYKTLEFNKCKIDYNIDDANRFELTLSRLTDYKSYIVEGSKLVKQTYKIYVNVPGLQSKFTYTNPDASSLINFMTPYNSFVEYSVEWQFNSAPYELLYKSQLYITNAKPGKVDANEYMKANLEYQNKEVLRNKYNEIITPMFMIDNKLNKLESTLNNIKDAYEFNRLNNMATQIRFYNTSS